MKSLFQFILWSCFLGFAFVRPALSQLKLAATTSEEDSVALVALYDSTGGDNWTNNSNWKVGSVETWFGVSVTGNRVSSLDLSSNNLNGVLPSQLGNMTELVTLKLNANNLFGEIPLQFGNLKKLTTLQLQQNQLSGAIPAEIGDMESLVILWIFENEISDEIPAALGNLSGVTQFNLSSNDLHGEIPATIWGLTNLLELRVNNNQLSGSISPEIGNLTQLKRLHLERNQFSGVLPTELGQTDLFDLTINNNNFEGDLPEAIAGLADMLSLNISANNFSGAIATEFADLSQMQIFWANDNDFSDLPDLSGIGALTNLRVSNNRLTFEDIEPNVGISNFSYSPQDSVGLNQNMTITTGSSLSLGVSVGGSANQYQWFKNGAEIPGATDSTYILASVVADDGGNYICRITNSIAAQLTLYRKTIKVTIQNPTGILSTSIPSAFALYPNFPNPFNPETTIQYDLPRRTNVRLDVFDVLGRKIRTLVNQEQTAGVHTAIWDGRAGNGLAVASGIYLCKIEAGAFEQISSMILIK